MSLKVTTPVSSLMNQNTVTRAIKSGAEKSIDVKSGAKVTEKTQDAIDLLLPEKLKPEIRSKNLFHRWMNEGISLIQTAEDGLSQGHSIISRMRKLAMQSSANNIGDSDRDRSSAEYEVLKQEFQSLTESSEYNGKKIFDGTSYGMEFLKGGSDDLNISSGAFTADLQALGVAKSNISSQESAQMSLIQMASALDKISAHRSQLNSLQGRLQLAPTHLLTRSENGSDKKQDKSSEEMLKSAMSTKKKISTEGMTSFLAQANSSARTALKLID